MQAKVKLLPATQDEVPFSAHCSSAVQKPPHDSSEKHAGAPTGSGAGGAEGTHANVLPPLQTIPAMSSWHTKPWPHELLQRASPKHLTPSCRGATTYDCVTLQTYQLDMYIPIPSDEQVPVLS